RPRRPLRAVAARARFRFRRSPIGRPRRPPSIPSRSYPKGDQLMATTTTTGGTVVFSNSGTAQSDFFSSSQTGLTEDVLKTVYFAVMANDGGGKNTTLWSLDDGTSSLTYATTNSGGSGVSAPTDLLAQDTARCEALSTDLSAHGARIWITSDGKVGYDAT